MPFTENFLNDASREIEVKSIKADFESVSEYIKRAVDAVADQCDGLFSAEDVDIYMHGSYASKTNIYFPSSLEIVVELKQTEEFHPELVKPGDYHLYNNYFVNKLPLEFTPQSFRDLFFTKFCEIVGAKASESHKTISFESIGKVKHSVEITPCFSFIFEGEGGEKYKGILLYDQSMGSHIVSFPKRHAENGKIKDIATKGNFKRTVRLFKSLNAIYAREFDVSQPGSATGYFIECLLYNVPNKLFLDNKGGEFSDIFLKVMNYLIHCDLDEFTCQNQVWQLFGTAKEFWNIKRAGDFLGAIWHLYNVFPPSRDFLA